MLLRHDKELEQIRRQNLHREEELVKRQNVERRAMPKRIRAERKARELMFRESLRISTTNLPDSHRGEKDRLKKVSVGEKSLLVLQHLLKSLLLGFNFDKLISSSKNVSKNGMKPRRSEENKSINVSWKNFRQPLILMLRSSNSCRMKNVSSIIYFKTKDMVFAITAVPRYMVYILEIPVQEPQFK